MKTFSGKAASDGSDFSPVASALVRAKGGDDTAGSAAGRQDAMEGSKKTTHIYIHHLMKVTHIRADEGHKSGIRGPNQAATEALGK